MSHPEIEPLQTWKVACAGTLQKGYELVGCRWSTTIKGTSKDADRALQEHWDTHPHAIARGNVYPA